VEPQDPTEPVPFEYW
jgi:hypothetical protein